MTCHDETPEHVQRAAAELVNAYLLVKEETFLSTVNSDDERIEPWTVWDEIKPKVDALLNTDKATVYGLIDTLLHLHYATLAVDGSMTNPPMSPYQLWAATGETFKPTDGMEGGDAPT